MNNLILLLYQSSHCSEETRERPEMYKDDCCRQISIYNKQAEGAMKLVSVNAVLIASVNISLFVNTYRDQNTYPPPSLFLLSLVFVLLIVLLEWEHRQFKQSTVSIRQSSFLHRKYLFLFATGLLLTLAQKYQYLKGQDHPYLAQYTLLGNSIHSSILYYLLNALLGLSYQWLYIKEYQKANRSRVDWFLASAIENENCAICMSRIEEGHKLGKIQCMHLYHLSCLNKWLKKKTQCPLCQSQIILTS